MDPQSDPVIVPRYDDALPITAWHDEILRRFAITRSSSWPGRPARARPPSCPRSAWSSGRRSIGHTQPRRIAARTVAERIAEELETQLGDLVGL